MNVENIALALLQSSITGAGLVLAVYALLTPILRTLFEKRAKELKDSIEAYRKKSETISTETKEREIREIRRLLSKIEEKRKLPGYMNLGIMLSFLMYVLSVFLSLWSLFDSNIISSTILLFIMATLIFLFTGVGALVDIYSAFREEYKSLKEEIDKRKSEARGF
ncbi:MAG: hypothetical protein QXZ17_09465 [Nitrososphaerota archaeon]